MVIQPTNSDFSQHNAVKSTNWDGIGQYGSPLTSLGLRDANSKGETQPNTWLDDEDSLDPFTLEDVQKNRSSCGLGDAGKEVMTSCGCGHAKLVAGNGLVGKFHRIGTIYGVFNIRVMGLIWINMD